MLHIVNTHRGELLRIAKTSTCYNKGNVLGTRFITKNILQKRNTHLAITKRTKCGKLRNCVPKTNGKSAITKGVKGEQDGNGDDAKTAGTSAITKQDTHKSVRIVKNETHQMKVLISN